MMVGVLTSRSQPRSPHQDPSGSERMTAGSAETLDAPGSPSSREGQTQTYPTFFNVGGLIDGRYAVVRPIGRGGMGRVVEVERISDQARLALKYCDGSALGRKRLVREARILGSLE